MSRLVNLTIHEVNYPEKSRLEKGADYILTPARYLFRGKTISVLNGKIAKQQLAFSDRPWIKTALMILLLIPSLLVGLPLKAVCHFLAPDYYRKMDIPSSLKPEFERVFSPAIFKSYREQLRACIRAELAKKSGLSSRLEKAQDSFSKDMRAFLKHTDEKIGNSASDNRAWHERWLKQLRKLVLAPNSKQEAQEIIDRVCLWMYSEVTLLETHQQMLRLEGGLHFPSKHVTAEALADELGKAWKGLQANPSFNKYRKEEVAVQDPHLQGNIPTLQFQIGKTQFIYTGRVTLENNKTGEVQIVPEFIRYLDALSRLQKRHLYVNLMNRTKGSERDISLKIEELERKKSGFSVVTLDNNSDFFKQGKPFDKLHEADKFKEAFIKHLFAADGSYHWPVYQDQLKWKQKCSAILDAVHAESFHNKAKLSVNERQAFIDRTHVAIVRALSEDADFANTTCKHSMDRGPRMAGLLFSDQMRSKKTLEPDAVKKFMTLVLAPPILSHNRVALERFVDRIKNALPYTLQVAKA